MSNDAPPRDRHAYLEEQIRRQKLGEPIDVDWVRTELERVRQEAAQKKAAIQRNMLWLAVLSGALLLLLWVRRGGLAQPGGLMLLAFILIGVLVAFALARRGR